MEKYETFWRRFGALLLDSIVLWIFNFLLTLGLVYINESELRFIIASAAVSLVYPLYFILLHTYNGGQTLGKMATRVKVMDDSETPLNFGQAVIRSLPQLIPALFVVTLLTRSEAALDEMNTIISGVLSGVATLFGIADIVVCLVNQKNRALHDFIAGTIVVKTDV